MPEYLKAVPLAWAFSCFFVNKAKRWMPHESFTAFKALA
jgi:hypothetical protein